MFRRILPYTIFERLLRIINLPNLIRSEVNILELIYLIFKNNYKTNGDFVLSNYGVWMKNNKHDKTFKLSAMGYRNGLDKILLSLKSRFVFVDIGANQGVFSLIAAKNKNCISIHAFEPNLKISKLLKSNLIRNKVSNAIIHSRAIGRFNTKLKFFVPDNHSGAGRISSKNSNMEVDCVNYLYLDKFLPNIEELFIKIDVEGTEYMVIEQFFKSSLNIKYIFVEINSKYNVNERATVELLNKNGFYEVFRKQNKISYDALFLLNKYSH